MDFLKDCSFRPPQMQIEQFIPWDCENGEMLFPCHTSFISQELLFEQCEKKGVDISSFKTGREHIKSEQMNYKEIIENKGKLKVFDLRKELSNEIVTEAQALSRVAVEAIDFNWLFENGNAEEFITILAKKANNETLLKR